MSYGPGGLERQTHAIKSVKLTVTCENTLFLVSLTKLVSSRPRDSSETFLHGKHVGHHAQSPVALFPRINCRLLAANEKTDGDYNV